MGAGSASAGASSGGSTFGGFTALSGNGQARIQTIEDAYYCTGPNVAHAGLVQYDTKQDGRFTYWGYEWALPDFVQCMKDRGYTLESAGRSELTDFGGSVQKYEPVQGN